MNKKIPFPVIYKKKIEWTQRYIDHGHVKAKTGIQLQLPEHNVAYNHDQQGLQHPSTTYSLTYTFTRLFPCVCAVITSQSHSWYKRTLNSHCLVILAHCHFGFDYSFGFMVSFPEKLPKCIPSTPKLICLTTWWISEKSPKHPSFQLWKSKPLNLCSLARSSSLLWNTKAIEGRSFDFTAAALNTR